MRVGVVGINHKLANLRLRELLAHACEKRFSLSPWTANNYSSVLLSTCNRTEVYFCSDDLTQTHSHFLSMLRQEVQEDFEQKLYSYFGLDCFLHLSQVTAGLDSALIGETEIQGQVKRSYEMTCRMSHLPQDLHFIFQKSLKIAKQVRSCLDLRGDVPDISHSVWGVGNYFFNKTNDYRVLFVGASEINLKLCAFLRERAVRDICLCNRTEAVAQEWSKSHGVSLLKWSDLPLWYTYDWIIFGTKSLKPLIGKEDLPKNHLKRKLIIDLAVPRNVSSELAKDPRVTLLNIDQIQRLLKRRTSKIQNVHLFAQRLIINETRKQAKIFEQKSNYVNACFSQEEICVSK